MTLFNNRLDVYLAKILIAAQEKEVILSNKQDRSLDPFQAETSPHFTESSRNVQNNPPLLDGEELNLQTSLMTLGDVMKEKESRFREIAQGEELNLQTSLMTLGDVMKEKESRFREIAQQVDILSLFVDQGMPVSIETNDVPSIRQESESQRPQAAEPGFEKVYPEIVERVYSSDYPGQNVDNQDQNRIQEAETQEATIPIMVGMESSSEEVSEPPTYFPVYKQQIFSKDLIPEA
ncbi:hypothetical protein RF11_15098 [Thelohanellus kitauei]|uniref:Uncharacterized protein n=1 Tax=Thelohanellus kitauei TaxID=669202 RepID=A0A0C2M7C3_THEKT|nr:hypothetical protein RF11_15098 [Thelohanellus kitauei]